MKQIDTKVYQSIKANLFVQSRVKPMIKIIMSSFFSLFFGQSHIIYFLMIE